MVLRIITQIISIGSEFMSYEEDYRKPYKATCACGQGFLRYYKIFMSNDWGQDKENATPVELVCECCANKYHYEHIHGQDYLVSNGLSFSKTEPRLDRKYYFDEKEKLIEKYSVEDIENIIKDMTAPKHRFITNLESKQAVEFAEYWWSRTGKKSLQPMVSYLEELLRNYDVIKQGYEKKKPFWIQYTQDCEEYTQANIAIQKQSFKLTFLYDSEQDEIEREGRKREQDKYVEEHQYDDFTAQVHYDQSYKKDFTNLYWDSYLIKECTDSQHLSLTKPMFGTPQVTIAKKYACICQICGRETEVLSSDLKILYNDEEGYYPGCSCSCHTISSFEAKTMDILNQLGITYIREKSFSGLLGNSGRPLRFDFALYKENEESIDLVIELQGPHHYKKGYYDEFGDYITDEDEADMPRNVDNNFERQLRYDEKKKEYCLQHGINLECIKYTVSSDYERLEKKIIEILKKYGYQYYVEQTDRLFI